MKDKKLKLKTIKPKEVTTIKVTSEFYSLLVMNYFSFCEEIGEETLVKCSEIIKNNSYNNIEPSLLKKVKTLYMYLDLIQGIEEGFEKDKKIIEEEFKESDFKSK